MGNTGSCLWGGVDSSRARTKRVERRGDFTLGSRSQMVSFSRADNKKCKKMIIVIKTKMCHQIYLGKVYVWETSI